MAQKRNRIAQCEVIAKEPFIAISLKRMQDGWHWYAEVRSQLESVISAGGGIYDPHISPHATPELALTAATKWCKEQEQ